MNLPDWIEYYGAKENTYEERSTYGNTKYSLLLGIDDEEEVADTMEETEDFDDFAVIHKLLGYANVIQSDMLLECEMVSKGVYCGAPPDVSDEELAKHEENRHNWQLLLQLCTIEDEGFEMMWGDCGRIYFFIKKEDLQKLNFDDCWLVLQCG
jgi:uncharacterized protein YwqG